ncbi:MAG TPA: hypothetical protein VF516_35965 [Kofleriaceae bacterium]
MSDRNADDVRTLVREHYGNLARGIDAGCAPGCADASIDVILSNCVIALDARGKVVEFTPRVPSQPCCPK